MSEIKFEEYRRALEKRPRPSLVSGLTLYLIAGLGLLASSGIAYGLGRLIRLESVQISMLITNLCYYLPFVALPIFLTVRSRDGLFECLRPNPISLFNVLSIVLMALMGVFLVNDITVLWSIPFEKLGFNLNNQLNIVPDSVQGLMLSVLTIGVLPAVCEEFLFRGIILSAWESRGTRFAMAVSAALFMTLHGAVIGMPAQFILGVILSVIVICCDSIYAGIIYHTIHNVAIVVLNYLQAQLPAETAETKAVDMFAQIGGWTGVLSLLVEIVLIGGLMLLTLKTFKLRARLRGIEPHPRKREALRGREWAILIAGLLVTLTLYAADIFSMLGGA